ncbi:protein of unknown function [Candidatus Promineifilum breve]|uniref:Uncharacterized protein n=1 Tax=Candidatus Promineifilum breve TaxID=1806508 RepID=A0A160T2R2_9CHLR|nr:hypothetical protein [Candidatus Promineifilum breve]CUS04236.2 protein of unknown function [Candidatus Promineifilum breve]
MTALEDMLDILAARHAAIVAAYDLGTQPAQQEAIGREALERLGLSPAAAALDGTQGPSARLALDVAVWAWVEKQAALLFDFSADGGSYKRSQLAESATRMRRLAEDRAAAAGLVGFGWPAVEMGCLALEDCGDEVGYAGI